MEEKYYDFKLDRKDFRYEFTSKSNEKQIKKVVIFSEVEKNFYNLALFDELNGGNLSDISESNNKDLVTIMATVFKIIDDFLSFNSSCFVIFRGSDEKRHRLYRIIIGKELAAINEKFLVFGVKDDVVVNFKIDENYNYFLIIKK